MKILKKILLEMIPVILGIWIALFLNNWKQNSENQRFLLNVLESIDKEMKVNVEDFNRSLPKQYALIDTINAYREDNKISLSEIIFKANGLEMPTVKNTSWKSFLNSKMELVKFEVISKLTDIEEAKWAMNKKADVLMEFFVTNSASTNIKDKNTFLMQLNNLLNSEEQLLKNCEEYLALENKANQ